MSLFGIVIAEGSNYFCTHFSWLVRPWVSCQMATAGMRSEGGGWGHYKPGYRFWRCSCLSPIKEADVKPGGKVVDGRAGNILHAGNLGPVISITWSKTLKSNPNSNFKKWCILIDSESNPSLYFFLTVYCCIHHDPVVIIWKLIQNKLCVCVCMHARYSTVLCLSSDSLKPFS